MSLPPVLQSMLLPDETVLWEGKPEAPKTLSVYKGRHTWIARAFFGLSSIMTLVYVLLIEEIGRFGLSTGLLVTVGGPLVIGVLARSRGARQARKAMRDLHYAVTSKRVLIAARHEPIAYTILPDTPVKMITDHNAMDVIILSDAAPFPYTGQDEITAAIYTKPTGMVIPKGEATLAMIAIQGVRDMA